MMNLKNRRLVSVTLIIGQLAVWSVDASEEHAVEYGADVSYPMHHPNVTQNYAWLPHNTDPSTPIPPSLQGLPLQLLGDRQSFYDDNIQGCVHHYAPTKADTRCLSNERVRVEMSLRQPKSMVNYTEVGYTKIKAPEEVMRLLKEFWQANRHLAQVENWSAGNTYTNHWKVPTKMARVEDHSMNGGGLLLKQKVWDAARSTIEQWTGQRLAECSLYGIRIYEEGAILATHVDRLPLVSSAIINVDQDVDEPWPLEVIGHDGKAANITMEPGDLVLYESHSVLHGRPFPLKGRFMANIFVHFEPVGSLTDPTTDKRQFTADLPPYLIPGSEEENFWRRTHPNGWRATRGNSHDSGSTEAHILAQQRNALHLNRALDSNLILVHARDANGWTALHEAVRSGCFDCVINLLQRGADVNALTADGRSPLHHAKKFDKGDLGSNKIYHFLERNGAKDIGPEL